MLFNQFSQTINRPLPNKFILFFYATGKRFYMPRRKLELRCFF